MLPQPEFGFKDLFTHLIADMVKAVCTRNGESQQQKLDRSQAAVAMIMGFLPRDAIEAMFAGHAVMFHELMVDTFRHVLTGEVDTMRRATRTSLIALDKAFCNNFDRLEHYRLRPSDGRRDDADAAVEPLAPLVQQTDAPGPRPAAAPLQPAPATPLSADTDLGFTASPDAIAAFQANPEAIAALEAGDPIRFARALGVDEPSEEFLAAANAPGSPFDLRRPFDPATFRSAPVATSPAEPATLTG
jgi:hypothetical protein